MNISTRTRWLATTLSVAAIAAPAAQAMDLPAGQPYPSASAVAPKETPAAVPSGFDFATPSHWRTLSSEPVQIVTPDGFDFRDAGVGAGIAAAALLLAGAAGAATRRHRRLANS